MRLCDKKTPRDSLVQPYSDVIATDLSQFDGAEIVAGLNQYLRLRTTPIGMKLFADKAEMEAIAA